MRCRPGAHRARPGSSAPDCTEEQTERDGEGLRLARRSAFIMRGATNPTTCSVAVAVGPRGQQIGLMVGGVALRIRLVARGDDAVETIQVVQGSIRGAVAGRVASLGRAPLGMAGGAPGAGVAR